MDDCQEKRRGGARLKAALAVCLCMVVGCTAFVAVAAAAGTLKPELPEPAFDPEMNGHYKNITADNGNVYTGDFVAGYYHGVGKLFGTYVGEFAADKRNGEGTLTYENGYIQTGNWEDDNFLG